MICNVCGTQNGNASFCVGCGTPLATSASTAPSAPTYPSTDYGTPTAGYSAPDPTAYGAPAPTKHPLKRFIIFGAAGVVAIALLIFLLNLGNMSAKRIARKCLDAEINYNYTQIASLVHSSEINERLDDMDKDREDFDDYLKDLGEDVKEENEEDDEGRKTGTPFSYEILGVSAIKGEDLAALKEYYDDEYDLKVSAAKSVRVEICDHDHGRKTNTYDYFITVVKIGGKWYLDYDDCAVDGWLESFYYQ